MSTPTPTPEPTPAATPDTATGRDATGRFARGNPGGPGNPFYRRLAECRRAVHRAFTPEDVTSLLGVMLQRGRNGDVAAARVFLEYVVGKPVKAPEPDEEDLHEWQLQRQTPRLPDVLELASQGIEAGRASQVSREMVEIVGACQLQTLSQHLLDGTDFAGSQVAPPLDETTNAAESHGGSRPGASARCLAAGVRSAVETGDNEADDDWEDDGGVAWLERELSYPDLPEQTGDNGSAPPPRSDGNGSPHGFRPGPRGQ
jgi:hypothetical protein